MVITLPPEIEQTLSELAEKQGTTIEHLALSAIREKFFHHRSKVGKRNVKTLADRLAPYIGVISSSEGANMSVDSGKKFAQHLLEEAEWTD